MLSLGRVVDGSRVVQRSRGVPRSRIALLVAAALAFGACGTNPPTASPTALVSASPTASAGAAASSTAGSGGAACVTAGIKASGGPWGGAAGSRGADVTVENTGPSACQLAVGPVVAAVDSTGKVLIQSGPPRVGEGPLIGPSGTVAFSLLFSNWCDTSVVPPITFRLAVADGAVDIGGLAMSTRDALPPCNGAGEPAALSTTDWQVH